MRQFGLRGDQPLPIYERHPGKPRDNEDQNDRDALPRIGSDGSLIQNEDKQDRSKENQEGTEIVQVPEPDISGVVEIVGPHDKQGDKRNEGTRATEERRSDVLHRHVS